MRLNASCLSALFVFFSRLAFGDISIAVPDLCAVCGGQLVDVYYSVEDKVTLEKKHVCRNCERWFPDCFVCGMPANTNTPGFVALADQRALCARDARTAVLSERDGLGVFRDVRDGVERLLSRFTSFPETNITTEVIDRVDLQTVFKLAGNDYRCPDVWGITRSQTNEHRVNHRISLMTGLPRNWFQATCAHELAHAWVAEHVPEARKQRLDQDAEEGFCELVAFLYMDSLADGPQKALILANAYTRGQIDLFVAAQRSYSFNEVVDWMQFGADGRLSATDPERIRKVNLPISRPVPAPVLMALPVKAPTAPDTLVLKAIFWDQKRPMVMINDCTLAINEEAKVRLGATNVLVRCLEVSPDSVRLRVAGNDQDQTLKLRGK